MTGCSISDTSAEVRVQLSADCDDHSLLRITIGGQALQPLLAEVCLSYAFGRIHTVIHRWVYLCLLHVIHL